MFVIEDEIRCDWHGEYAILRAAVAELRRRAAIPRDRPPNAAPRGSSATCGRAYVIIEVDASITPQMLQRAIPGWNVEAGAAARRFLERSL